MLKKFKKSFPNWENVTKRGNGGENTKKGGPGKEKLRLNNRRGTKNDPVTAPPTQRESRIEKKGRGGMVKEEGNRS